MYQVTRLKNGLTVVTSEMPHMTSVESSACGSASAWTVTNRREVNGVSHFRIEHLLFKGTKRRSARQISQDVEGVGGYLNAFTGEEMTCYHSKARHDRFDELLDVLTDMFLNSKFDPVEINKRARRHQGRVVHMHLDQPQYRVQELLNEMLWPNQPLGRPIAGTEKSLDALNRANLVAYQRKNYVANRIIFAAAGRLTHRQVVQRRFAAREAFSARQTPAVLPWPRTARTASLTSACSPRKPERQRQMALGIRTLVRGTTSAVTRFAC